MMIRYQPRDYTGTGLLRSRLRPRFSIWKQAVVGLVTACLVPVLLQCGFLVPVPVFAATSSMLITSEDVFLIPANGSLQVAERISLSNSSGQAQDVQLPLPAGAQQVDVTNVPQRSVSVSKQGVTLRGVKSGPVDPVVTFTLSFSDQTAVQLTLHNTYDLSLLHIYVPIGNAALSAPGLMAQTQTAQISGTNFRVFTHGELPPNSDFTLSLSLLPNVTPTQAISGLPVIGTDSQGSASSLQAVGNLVLAAAILVIALLGIRSMMAVSVSSKQPEEALYLAWEEVERAYEAGQLDDAEYERRRSSVRRRIAQLTAARRRER